jgi:hypothetical protein
VFNGLRELKYVTCHDELYVHTEFTSEHKYAWKPKVRTLKYASDTFLYFAELGGSLSPPPPQLAITSLLASMARWGGGG